MLKKEVIIEKTSKILSEKPIIYIYQYNGSKNQRFLKSELSKIENVSALVIPNRRMHNPPQNMFMFSGGEIKKLFQGPSLLLGCNKLEELSSVLDVLKNHGHGFSFSIGGLFENQIITHLTSLQESPAMLDFIHYLQTKLCI